METSYPVFESGQVLTSGNLNDLVEYLEEQDRLTRNKLIGIGIACGLEVGYERESNRIRIGSGCAVTSQGYLIVHEECLVDRFRDYSVPKSDVEEMPNETGEEQLYDFFFNSDGNQVSLWELLPTTHTSGAGELPPTAISESFLSDKVAMLFLECNLESLKNCDISDCSDKGAEMEFTLRRLLVGIDDAKRIIARENKIAGRPADLHNHPKWALSEVDIEKINPAAHAITTFEDLALRIHKVMNDVGALKQEMQSSYKAFRYLISDMYPVSSFPDGPFPSDYFTNVMTQYQNNVFLIQHLYDYLYDLAQAHREFLRAAIELEAECCPNSDRFPKHVLLGLVKESKSAFAPDIASGGAVDPLSADSGFGAREKPAAFRHHFVPSMLFDRQHERLREVRSLHYRLYLLAYRYSTDDLIKADIRITPSKDGDYDLSDKAIPFYYAFSSDDDLHRNWSYGKTVKNRLAQVYSYQLLDEADHPLKDKREDHNFYRVEGVVGKSLHEAMSTLLDYKRKLGLSFAIEPVYLGVTSRDVLASNTLDAQAQERAQEALKKIFLCRLRDLDVVFLVLMAALFSYLYTIVSLLSRGNTSTIAGAGTPTTRDSGTATTLRSRLLLSQPLLRQIRTDVERTAADAVLRDIRPQVYTKGDVTSRVTTETDPVKSIGAFYESVKDAPSTSNLFDRTRAFAGTLNPEGDADAITSKIYPTVSLLDKTEDLIDVVSAKSLAEFDQRNFEQKYEGFVNAFDDYLAQGVGVEEGEPAEVADTKEMLATTYNAIASTGPQSLVSNLNSELQERMANVYSELQLKGYAQRHPGMEHKCGVPAGGTLILLYSHRKFVAQVLRSSQKRYSVRIRTVRASMGLDKRSTAFTDPEQALAVSSSSDPTDDFVVLADFCVPYLCCDTDCSDIVLEEEQTVESPPIAVKGAVFGVGDTVAPLRNVRITATNLDTNKQVAVEVAGAEYKFSGPAGSYKIEVASRGFVSDERTVYMSAGKTSTVNLILEGSR